MFNHSATEVTLHRGKSARKNPASDVVRRRTGLIGARLAIYNGLWKMFHRCSTLNLGLTVACRSSCLVNGRMTYCDDTVLFAFARSLNEVRPNDVSVPAIHRLLHPQCYHLRPSEVLAGCAGRHKCCDGGPHGAISPTPFELFEAVIAVLHGNGGPFSSSVQWLRR